MKQPVSENGIMYMYRYMCIVTFYCPVEATVMEWALSQLLSLSSSRDGQIIGNPPDASTEVVNEDPAPVHNRSYTLTGTEPRWEYSVKIF